MDDTTVSATELGELIGVSARTIRELAAAGAIERTARGQYALKDSVRRAFSHLRAAAAGRGAGGAGVADLATERALLARIQREAIALKLARERGEVVDAALLVDGVSRVAAIAVSHLRPLAKFGARAARAAATDADAEQALEALVSRVRTGIADEIEAFEGTQKGVDDGTDDA